ncbi:acidic mammalian chitinase-like isoform X2 [Biomphalaria glabrata]|uniref:Acidic mammalian chitinase-like isoform X2 n=1 Tax=Biomphalaria glabrata TaxID=6526 RepID=A0A9W2ZPQ1_BIOGL|nr:acidic mammalian chitinase-like isoform X2 [Biomphalaria glabrata]
MLVSLLIFSVLTSSTLAAFRSVCYYTNWSQYRNGRGKFVPENVDPNLCTHLIYAFGKPEGTTIVPFEWNDDSTDWSQGMYERAINLKQRNPNLKVLLAIGGYNMASDPFTSFVSDSGKRAEFVKNAIEFLRKRNFDGLDMDWEYPGQRGSPPEDREHLVLLMQELWNGFHHEAYVSNKPRLLLTAAFPAGKESIDIGYDIQGVINFIDFINIMTYDFHGSWESYTGLNGPLFAHPSDHGNDSYLNLDWAVQYYLQLNAPKDKLNVGISTYGRSFLLDSASNNGIRAPAAQPGDAGKYTAEKGFVSYYEVCELIKAGAQVVDVPTQRGRYLVKDRQWIGYDDIQTVTEKACYTRQHGFGGVMFWAVDLDDFLGQTCGQGKYPLMTAVLREMTSTSFANCPVKWSDQTTLTTRQSTASTTQRTSSPTTQSTTVSTQRTTTTEMTTNAVQFDCSDKPNGVMYPNPDSPSTFYECYNQVAHLAYCVVGLQFDPALNRCDFPPTTTVQPNEKPDSTEQPITTEPVPTSAVFDCTNKQNDFYPDPTSCNSFYVCLNQAGMKVDCSFGMNYNPQIKTCDYTSDCHHVV